MHNPVFVHSTITGGHWALKTQDGKKPFQNPMDIYTRVNLFPSDIVADIGAYVGEYSLYAARKGVQKVLSYEPTPSTFQILKMNARSPMELFNLAVVGSDQKMVDLYISRGVGVTNSIAKKDRKAGRISVPSIQYQDAIRNATVVKIDVEGAEYLFDIIQPGLRAIILEFHPISGKPWRSWADRIMQSIEDHGFLRVYRPTFESGWNLTGCWSK